MNKIIMTVLIGICACELHAQGHDMPNHYPVYTSISEQIADWEEQYYHGTYHHCQYTATQTPLIDSIKDGYADRLSYRPGDTVQLFLSSRAIYLNRKFYLYDLGMSKRDSVISNIGPQSPTTNRAWVNYEYCKTFSYIIPPTMRSGMYHFGNKVFFIVKDKSRNKDITVVYPSNTEEAYNNEGGKSLYNFNSSGNQRADTVTFQRPLGNFILDEIQGHSRPFMKWLWQLSGLSIQYITDADLNNYKEIEDSRLLVVIGHSEYWSRQARLNFDKFVNKGNHAMVLSGNTMCWQVRYTPGNNKLVCFRDVSADPENNTLEKTIQWTEPSLNYPVLKSIGCDWPHGAYGMKAGYPSLGGYKIVAPNSPLLEGTNLAAGSTLSCQSYEYDATLFSGFKIKGEPILDTTTLGFCKIEMLGYDMGAKTTTNVSYQYGYGTFVIFQKNPNSGKIVNAAFNTFTGKTPSYGSGGISGPDSVKIRTIVLNCFSKLLKNEMVFSGGDQNCREPDTGLHEEHDKKAFLLWPNPAEKQIYVACQEIQSGLLKIEIYDVTGATVLSTAVTPHDGQAELTVSELREGIYTVYLHITQNEYVVKKLIIVR